jgi:hypothetical protein
MSPVGGTPGGPGIRGCSLDRREQRKGVVQEGDLEDPGQRRVPGRPRPTIVLSTLAAAQAPPPASARSRARRGWRAANAARAASGTAGSEPVHRGTERDVQRPGQVMHQAEQARLEARQAPLSGDRAARGENEASGGHANEITGVADRSGCGWAVGAAPNVPIRGRDLVPLAALSDPGGCAHGLRPS